MAPLILHIKTAPAKLFRLLIGTAMGFLLSASQGLGQAPTNSVAETGVLTNIFEIWQLPPERRENPFRMRIEVVLYYFDPSWSVAWGECGGAPTFLPLVGCPHPLKAGQRLLVDGIILPRREQFDWDRTRVQILEENLPLAAKTIQRLGENPRQLQSSLVSVEGLVDSLEIRPTHFVLNFLVGGGSAKVHVYTGSNAPAPHFKTGDYVRLKGVYSAQFDREENLSDLTLWVARSSDIRRTGSLAADSRFNTPIMPSSAFQAEAPAEVMVHVEGMVRSQVPGKSLTLWDDTGQVIVQSRQTEPLHFGERVEAIGNPFILGVQNCMRSGLYRRSTLTNGPAIPRVADEGPLPLCLAERIRHLSREEAARNLPVRLRAVVTWSHAETAFAFVQDASGGIRLDNPRYEMADASKPGTVVTLEGVTSAGEFVPVVTNAYVRKIGWWNLEEARSITLEQALTGAEEGRWVEMRGFVRQLTQIGGLRRLDLSTSRGDFQLWTPASPYLRDVPGAIVRVRGVCAAIPNDRRQLTGIQLWTPEVQYIQVEQSKPEDEFAFPLRALGDLRRYDTENALNQRVRTSGTVVLHVPGRYLYVQERSDSVFALSDQLDPLNPGDRVEVVGFPGNDGRRYLLREARYRRLGSGPEPAPVRLTPVRSLDADWEGVLANAQGTLLNKLKKEGEVRLLIGMGESTFEASLASIPAREADALEGLELGSRLAATGVYQLQSDDYGNERSFLLRLRSWADIEVLRQPPWWTLRRALWMLAAVLALSLVAVYWSIVLSRKNRQLSQAQDELQAAKDLLELRVEERTQELQQRTLELQEQVLARERARDELAEAQRSLMLASRQAGMAEVATGVLHNVGNVLNSVNVSAAVVEEKVTNSNVLNLAKVLELLRAHQHDLNHFLTQDPRGGKLISYLDMLNTHLVAERNQIIEELGALTRNVEHIKEIVAMQQSYAQASGVLEIVPPAELVEDALRMHAAADQKPEVTILREFEPVPAITVDRHKTLQILTNLLQNAWYACKANARGNRIVTLRVSQPAPNRVRIEVLDNGAGIPAENLTRIFSFGFTTRQDGHGFGLHSGALAAREMGGTLTAWSEGVGQGARFTLELPTVREAGTGAPRRVLRIVPED